MTTDTKIRTRVLYVHALLSLGLGLFLFVLRSTMTNLLYEVFAVGIAIVISAVSLILAGITDWVAAFSEGMKHAHRLVFYLLAGLFLVLAGITIGYYSQITMKWLVIFAAVHALAFGMSALAFAFKARLHHLERRVAYIVATISVAFSAVMAESADRSGQRSAISMLATYLCFLGARLLLLVWELQSEIMMVKRTVSGQNDDTSVLSDSSSGRIIS
jgi:hypothetical protein